MSVGREVVADRLGGVWYTRTVTQHPRQGRAHSAVRQEFDAPHHRLAILFRQHGRWNN